MNKTNHVLTVSFAVAIVSSVSAFAQNATPAPTTPAPGGAASGRRAELTQVERIKEMKEKLNLTDGQSDKMKAVFEKLEERMKALRADSAVSQTGRRAKFGEAFNAMTEEAMAILNPEQQAKWKEEMEKRGAELGDGGSPARFFSFRDSFGQ